jgi:hypothetical protein
MRSYRAVFSRQAMGFVAAADDDAFAEINHWVDRIERTPGLPGDYTEQDDEQRELQVTVLRRTAVTYWPDHATQEVRVVRIEANQEN